MNATRKNLRPPASHLRPAIRCAIYTRKSTEEGLEQEFNSLDAQRESGEAYIASQTSLGWECLPDSYDDGGFTGGNTERPALKRLLADIEAGKVDCIVVYKVDRLSRSLIDFTKLMEVFDRANVSFVSVTQQFNTTSSMGRLTLNILLSFAQFEREIISERTRDQIAATRRRGKWSGGMPLLGYDVELLTSKLVVNQDEAQRVRDIYQLYLDHQSLIRVIDILDERGWVNKLWKTRKETFRGGGVFNRSTLHRMLTNVTYLGKLRYKTEIHEGEHDAIIDLELWRRVQTMLARNGRSGGGVVKNQFGALLKGRLRCTACDCAMVPSHTTKKGNVRYRYYVCSNAQKRGWKNCPSKSVPASELEQIVVEQLRAIGSDEPFVRKVFRQAQQAVESQLQSLAKEADMIARDVHHWTAELDSIPKWIDSQPADARTLNRLAELKSRIDSAWTRQQEIELQTDALRNTTLTHAETIESMSNFDCIWQVLTTREQERIIGMLVEEVSYDGGTGQLSITFQPSNFAALN